MYDGLSLCAVVFFIKCLYHITVLLYMKLKVWQLCHMWHNQVKKIPTIFICRALWQNITHICFELYIKQIRSCKYKVSNQKTTSFMHDIMKAKIKKLILSSSSKSCDLDSILTKCLDILLISITDIITILMESSTFLQNFKEAHLRPLLKKHLSLKTNWKIIGRCPAWVSFPKS